MSYATRIKTRKLPSGGEVLFSPFPSHGMMSIVGSIAGGGRLAQSDALAQVHASQLLEGTRRRSKTEIQNFLDSIGASLAFSIENDRLVFSAHVRDVHLKKLLALIGESLCEPSFPSRELAHQKERMMAELSLESQDTHAQASINLSHILYPADHPNYQDSTQRSCDDLELITRSDLMRYHAHAIKRDSLVVSVSGDMDISTAIRCIEQAFSKLPKNGEKLPVFTPAQPQAAQRAQTRIEDKASIDYLMGVATGITKDDPDYPALFLGLQILGMPGFTGRLMRTVREAEGLTYDVRSFLDGFSNADGACVISATFAPQLFEQGKASIMRQVRLILDDGVLQAEVTKYARTYEARTRVMASNSASIARIAHQVAVEGRKPSYLDEFPKKVLSLTAKAVNSALKKYLVIANLSESSAGPITS